MVKVCDNCSKWCKFPTSINWGICESEEFKTAYGKKVNPSSHKTYACKFWVYNAPVRQEAK